MHADTRAEADEPMGVHFCNILHILRTYDRFENTFRRWSVCRQRDRQQLVLTLADDATLSHSVIAAVCMMYPQRIAGPFLSKNIFTVELLDEAVHFDAHADAAAGVSLKRKREPVESAIDAIGSDLARCMHASNSSAVYVAKTVTGSDGGGEWMSYELSACDRVDLSFIPTVFSGPDSELIKVCRPLRTPARPPAPPALKSRSAYPLKPGAILTNPPRARSTCMCRWASR